MEHKVYQANNPNKLIVGDIKSKLARYNTGLGKKLKISISKLK